jgi:phosphatidylserine decarboxylase
VMHYPLPPPFAQTSVRLFAHWYHLNLAEAELPLAQYPTIGALFSRRLKPGVRPIGQGPVHPVDALITASGPIDQRTPHSPEFSGGEVLAHTDSLPT